MLCSCGCGKEVSKDGNIYIHGHNSRGTKDSEETRRRKSKSLIGIPLTKLHRENIGKSGKGKIPWNKGLTKELDSSVKKISESKKGKITGPQTEEHIRKRVIKLKGKSPWNKGLDKETSGSVRKISLSRVGKKHSVYSIEKIRRWMKINGSKIRKQIKNPSGPELKLRAIVKELYLSSDHTYKVLENIDYDVDIALPEFKIAIEYDGWYHFDTEEHKEYHKKRQQEIEQEGWKFLRYTIFDKFPTKEQVEEDILKLVEKI